jgi:hypothetical protein
MPALSNLATFLRTSACTLADTLDCCQRILVLSPVTVNIEGAAGCDGDDSDEVDPFLAVATPGTGTHW